MPTLRQLEYLIALADTLHFRRAAERVHATQSTLSEQLQALECRLGVQLVERSRSKVVITTIGHEVVEVARRALHDVRCIRDITGNNDAASAASSDWACSPQLVPTFCRASFHNFVFAIRSLNSMSGRSYLTNCFADLVMECMMPSSRRYPWHRMD